MARPRNPTDDTAMPALTLKHLPRETRDTLFLLTVIAWVLLPHASQVPLWCIAMVTAVIAWRSWLAWNGRPLPGKWWMLAIVAIMLGATFATFRTLFGRDAGVTLVVTLLALKTLELRARRDAFVVFFLGFFTMVTSFFYSQSLLTAAMMLVGVLGLLTALVNAHMVVGKPPLMQALRTAALMVLVGAPIMGTLFLLFPRMAPLWGIPADAMTGRSGLSATMQVGNLARLALDESIAMRIQFDEPPPPQRDLYFRGPVLSRFDGREWRPLNPSFAAPPGRGSDVDDGGLRTSGPPVRYQVTLEPSSRPWVFVLDAAGLPPQLSGVAVAMTTELLWMADRALTDIVRYRAQSHPVFQHGPLQLNANTRAGLREYVALPPGYNPRTLQLAADLRREPGLAAADGAARVSAVMERLRSGGYTYTLEPGTTGPHSADEFWFDSKAGFCEHIASAFVVLMRALDVPARIVTGYQGGQINAVDGFWTLRQSDAHAWAEVWLAGRGWVRVDPTSAVAPGRTGTFARLSAPAGVVTGAMAAAIGAFSPNLIAGLRQTWEAVNNQWNQWVLNYTQSRQLKLLQSLGFESPSREDLSHVLIAIVVGASLLGAAWTLWERRQHDPWLRLLARARRQLAEAGVSVPPNAPPGELARSLARASATPAQIQALSEWLLRLEQARYAPAAPGHARPALAALRQEFKHLPWPRTPPPTTP